MPASPRSPRRARGARRALVGALGIALIAGLVQVPVAGDEISDTRSEAERVADRIEELQLEAEVATEEFLEARLAREDLDGQIAEADERARRSGARLEEIRDEVRGVALESYMSDGSSDPDTALLGASDATDVSTRRGYASSVGADNDDLMDELRGSESRAASDARALDELRTEAQRVEEEMGEARDATEARIAELEDLERSIQGRLAELVEAEQARRAAEAKRRAAEAQAAAERAAAEEAARAAEAAATTEPEPEPAAAAPDPEVPAPTTEAPAPTTPSPAPAPTPAPAPAPAPAPPPPPSGGGASAAIAAARSVLGTPYKWGGASPSQGFDCSGLILWAWAHGGKSLPHSSRALYAMSAKIPISQLQPGDLVFYNSPISHVGLYIGGGQMIHAPRTGSHVKIDSIHYWSAIVGGGRI